MNYIELLDRAESVTSLLPDHETSDGRELVRLCRRVAAEIAPEEIPALRVELSRLVELLGRRSSSGVPLATLGRATLARVGGLPTESERLLHECDQQLSGLGL